MVHTVCSHTRMAEAIIDAQASDRRRARASQGASYVLQTNYGGAVTPLGDGMGNTFVHVRVFDAYRVARTPEVEHKTTNFLFSDTGLCPSAGK